MEKEKVLKRITVVIVLSFIANRENDGTHVDPSPRNGKNSGIWELLECEPRQQFRRVSGVFITPRIENNL